MSSKAKLIRRRNIFKGYCFDVTSDRVLWPNGVTLERSLIIHPGITVMVPLLDKNHLILIHQYRYGADRVLWEVPAGTLKKAEKPLLCARRELQEEIGYRAWNWKKLASVYASPGFNTEIMHCFLAQELEKTKSCLEPDEILEPKVFSLRETKKMIESGKIKDAKTLIALFYFFNGVGRR
jgi:ADP-ribose pyrophosphatase